MMKVSKIVLTKNFQEEPAVIITSHDPEHAGKVITTHATKYGLVSSEIKITFNPATICALDIIDALSDKLLRKALEGQNICGNALPIKLTEAESLALYDHKHDEN